MLTADPSPSLVGSTRHHGLDFLVVDAEQTGVTAAVCAPIVSALQGSSTRVAVRVPDLEDRTLVEYANTGADELVLPQIRSVAQLEQAHAATRFPPDGWRSRQVSPASAFGQDFSRAPRLTPLIETVEAVEQLDGLLSSGYCAAVWIGPNDLGDDYARRGAGREALDSAITEILEKGRAHGVPVGMPAVTQDDIDRAYDRGAGMCAVYWEKWIGRLLQGLRQSVRTGDES